VSPPTRWIIIALLCIPTIGAIGKWKAREIESAWNEHFYPAPQSPAVTPLGDEILRRQDSNDMNHFLREYHRVEGLVAEAQRKGADVSMFVGRLKDSTILARNGAFREARFVLNRVEMGLPHPTPPVVPASREVSEAQGAPIEGRPVPLPR